MSNENDESIVLDRDTSKPEPRLKRKVKKVIKKVKKAPQKKKEDNEEEEDKSEELPPINNKGKVDKATSRQTSLMNNKKSEEEEEEEDEEPLKVKKNKETNEEEEDEEKESEEENDNDDKSNPLIEDANVKYLEKNLKKEYNDKEVQCDIDKDLVQNITNELTVEMQNKETEHQKEIENIKAEYDKKQQSMIDEIAKLKNALSFEIKTKIDTMKKLQDEIAIKDKNIQTLSNTNEKMRKSLTDLSNEVNSLFVQLTTTKKLLQSKEKSENEKKNMDELIKSKDKEIKNSMALVQILSRDNRRLQSKLDNYAEYNVKVGLENTIKAKDAEILKLNNEIKLLKKEKNPNDINAKNESLIESLTKELNVLKNDIKVLKEENKTLKQKADVYLQESKEKTKKLISSSSAINIKAKKNLSLEKSKENQMCNSSLTLATNSKCFYSLFTEEERNILMKYFNRRGGFDIFIKKITTLESYRSSNENMIKSSVKHLESLLASKEEQIEYLLLKNKENEMKLRISLNNVNEGKNTIKAYQRKNNEQQSLIDSLLSNLQAQENQLKYLNEQYIQLQKKEIQDITKDTISIDLDKIIEKDKTTVEENKSKEIQKIENIVTYKEVPIDYKEIVVPTPPKKEEKKTEEVILPKIEEKKKEEEKAQKGDRINADQENAEIEVVKKKKKTVKKKVVEKKKDEKTKEAVDVIQCEKHSVK